MKPSRIETPDPRPFRLAECYAQIYCDLGDRYLANNDLQAAIRHFGQSLKFDPDQTEAHVSRALCLVKRGDWDKSLADLNAVIRSGGRCVKAFRLRALVRMKQGNFAAAVRDLTQAIRLEPRNEALYRLRAAAYAALGNWEAATKDFVTVVEICPSDNPARGLASLTKEQIAERPKSSPRERVSLSTMESP
jgi:Tfp pilus assembly protein PilF